MMITDTNYEGDEHGIKQAYWLAVLSDYAYKEQSKLGEALAKIGISDWSFFKSDKTDTQCLVVSTEHANIVVFRGTTNFEDWKINLKLARKKFLYGRVHRGFLMAYKSVRQDILSSLDSMSNGGVKATWFTGHSLGGALATIACAEHLYENRNLGGLYTYGSPRVFNKQAARSISSKTKQRAFRYVNNNDIVTRIPLARRFKHVDQFQYFNENGIIDSDISRWRKIKDRVSGARKDLFEIGSDARKDHGIKNYISNLEGSI